MRFIWDDKKEKTNKRKHKEDFSEACTVFADRYALSFYDEEHSKDEDRWITMGQSRNGSLLVVIHTYRSNNGDEYVRIISSRKATKNEAGQYGKRRS